MGIDVQYEPSFKLNARSRPLLFLPEPCPVGPARLDMLSVQNPKTRRVNGHNLTSRKGPKGVSASKTTGGLSKLLNKTSFRRAK